MEEKTLIEKLRYIQSRGIEIKWEKLDTSLVFFMGKPGELLLHTELPEYITIYTNHSLEEAKNIIDRTISRIESYDKHVKSLEDVQEVLDLKNELLIMSATKEPKERTIGLASVHPSYKLIKFDEKWFTEGDVIEEVGYFKNKLVLTKLESERTFNYEGTYKGGTKFRIVRDDKEA